MNFSKRKTFYLNSDANQENKTIVVETRRFEIAQSHFFTNENCDRFSMMSRHFFRQQFFFYKKS